MRSGLKMTVMEAEQFLNQTEDVARSLADPWVLDPAKEYDEEGNPTGKTHELDFDANTLLWTIMLKGGELGVLFNNVATYYKMNAMWWNKWKPTFQKWWEVEEIEYNPMWDRDGRRKFHEDVDDDAHSDTTTHNTGNSNTVTHDEGTEDVATHDEGTSKTVTHDEGTSKTVTHDEGTADTTINGEYHITGTSDRDTDFATSRKITETPIGDVSVVVHDGKDDTYSKSYSNDTNMVSAFDSDKLVVHDATTHIGGQGNGDSILKTYSSITDTKYDGHSTTTTEETKTPDHTDEAETYDRSGNTTEVTHATTQNDGTSNTNTTNDGTSNTNTTNDGTVDRDTTADGTSTTNTVADGTANVLSGNNRDIDHTYREWGQWGISTINQKMYELQYKVRKQCNPYELMSDIFIKEMTDGVWV